MGGFLIQKHEIEFVVNNYMKMSDAELSSHLNRPANSLSVLRSKLGCLRSFPHRRYTKKERQFIVSNYQSMTNIDMAMKLNRSDKSISTFMVRNGFVRARNKPISRSKIVEKKVIRMKELIAICETTKSPYQKDKAVQELKKLSEL